jgi:hypothetical protein
LLEQQLSKVADLEVKLKDTNDRLLECGQNSSSLDNSRLSDSRFTGSALAKSAADMNNNGEQIEYETNYYFKVLG